MIQSKLRTVEYSKNEIITGDDQVEPRIHFVLDGIARMYLDLEEKEITKNFMFPNSFISSYSSFLTGEKSDYVIQALKNCHCAYLEKPELQEIYEQTSIGNALGRIFAENMFVYLSRRETAFLTKTPSQRYNDLFEEQPELIQEIPLKYLASYIGITPQALSRIRAKV